MALPYPVRIDGKRFHWHNLNNPKNHGMANGSAYISDLDNVQFERVEGTPFTGVTLVGKNEEIIFVVDRVDWADPGHEDIGGWWLKSIDRNTGLKDGRFTILIIND